MPKKFVSLLSFILFSSNFYSQDVTFYAQVDAQQVVIGNYFEVSFTLENAQNESFQAPDFSNFEVLSGPSRSSQMTIVNGKMSQKMTFSYGLSAIKEGRLTIPPASVTIKGKKYSTNPISIQVLKGGSKNGVSPNNIGNPNAINTSDFIVEAQLNYDTGHIGQQLTLKYVLYTTKDVRSYNFLQIPKFDGFFAQEIQNYRDRQIQVVKDGKQYASRTIKVIALFPQQKGTFIIDPANVNLGVASRSSRTSFFFNSNLKPVRVASNKLEVQIVDLPAGAPSSFAGAVGDFYMGSAIDKKSLTMDDAITLTYQIKGNGDGKIIQAPDQPFSDLFDIYEPNLLREESKVVADKIETTKTFEYLMIPKKVGTLQFNPELSYFNTDSNQYKTIVGQTYSIRVAPSTGRQTADLNTKNIELPPIYSTTTLKPKNQFFFGSKPYWIINGLLGFGLIGILIAKKVQLDREKIDPADLKHSRAKKLAITQLAVAKKEWDKGNTKEFYIQLKKGLIEYLSSKTYQSSNQMSKDDISQLLKDNHLQILEEDIINIMKKGEMAIYAHMTPGNENEIYQTALGLIEKVETSLKS